MSIISDIEILLKARSIMNRFKDEVKGMGVLAAVRTIGLAIFPPAVAYVTNACPALFDVNGLIAIAGGVVAVILSRRASSGVGKSVVAGAGVAGVLSLAYSQAIAEVSRLCGSGFVEQLPTILSAALAIGVGAYLSGRKGKV